MVVILFDIDGTLIQTGGAGGTAMMSAFSDLFGIAEPIEVSFSGRTDRGIARDLFRATGSTIRPKVGNGFGTRICVGCGGCFPSVPAGCYRALKSRWITWLVGPTWLWGY